MKARNRKTGEIVDIICWNGSTVRSCLDTVSYIDSQGVEHDRESLNYYWDFESIDKAENDTHWQNVRERAAIAAMQGTITLLERRDGTAYRDIVVAGYTGSRGTCHDVIADFAVACADALVNKLNR